MVCKLKPEVLYRWEKKNLQNIQWRGTNTLQSSPQEERASLCKKVKYFEKQFLPSYVTTGSLICRLLRFYCKCILNLKAIRLEKI